MILPTNRWYAGAAILSGVGLLALIWPSAVAWFVAVDVLWVIVFALDAWRVGALDWNRVTVQRDAPPALSLRRSYVVPYVWRNELSHPLHLTVRETFPTPIGDHHDVERSFALGSHGRLVEDLTIRPLQRGRAEGGTIHVRLRSSLGMAWRQVTREVPWALTVYPDLSAAAIRALPAQARRRREAGARQVRRLGEGRVFESLRDGVAGDDPRTIDWKATAKRGKVMVRQYEDERRQQVLIVIDAGRMLTAETDGIPRLEHVINAAFQLASAAVEHDDDVGLMAFSDTVQHFIPPARGTRALRRIVDALATIEGKLVEPNYPSAFAHLAAKNRKRALTVVFTDVVDRTASEALVAHVGSLAPRHLPVTVALRDPQLDRFASARPATIEAAFERAAAEELLQARSSALAAMRSRGVVVVDVAPAGAAQGVVEQYHLLKRRGAL